MNRSTRPIHSSSDPPDKEDDESTSGASFESTQVDSHRPSFSSPYQSHRSNYNPTTPPSHLRQTSNSSTPSSTIRTTPTVPSSRGLGTTVATKMYTTVASNLSRFKAATPFQSAVQRERAALAAANRAYRYEATKAWKMKEKLRLEEEEKARKEEKKKEKNKNTYQVKLGPLTQTLDQCIQSFCHNTEEAEKKVMAASIEKKVENNDWAKCLSDDDSDDSDLNFLVENTYPEDHPSNGEENLGEDRPQAGSGSGANKRMRCANTSDKPSRKTSRMSPINLVEPQSVTPFKDELTPVPSSSVPSSVLRKTNTKLDPEDDPEVEVLYVGKEVGNSTLVTCAGCGYGPRKCFNQSIGPFCLKEAQAYVRSAGRASKLVVLKHQFVNHFNLLRSYKKWVSTAPNRVFDQSEFELPPCVLAGTFEEAINHLHQEVAELEALDQNLAQAEREIQARKNMEASQEKRMKKQRKYL